jgi:hypothetical protein
MPRRIRGRGCGCKTGGRKRKLHNWAKKGKQRGGFIFSFAAISAAISAALASSTAATIGTAALSAATAYGTNAALNAATQKGSGRRRIRSRRN